MNRMVNASPTNPSAISLSGVTPSSCGWRNPRLYSWVAIVDVLTFRNVSSTPAGSASNSGSVICSAPAVRGCEGLPLPQRKPGRAVAAVDQLCGGDGVVRSGRHRRSAAQRLDERFELVDVGRAGAEVLGRLAGLGADHHAVVLVRLDEVHDRRLAAGPPDAQRHRETGVGHAAVHRAGGAGWEAQVGLQPLVDPGRPGTFLRPGVDQLRLTTGPATERTVG